ncbi:MAG: hypothetical protein WBA17_11725, partial [Saprospiraceae bacterium]
VTALSAQVTVNLRPGANDDHCAGFNDANIAVMEIAYNPPFPPSSTTVVEYYWTVEHELGTWAWQTDRPDREFLIPFMGEYTIKCKVLYVQQSTRLTYAAFQSNVMIVDGKNC